MEETYSMQRVREQNVILRSRITRFQVGRRDLCIINADTTRLLIGHYKPALTTHFHNVNHLNIIHYNITNPQTHNGCNKPIIMSNTSHVVLQTTQVSNFYHIIQPDLSLCKLFTEYHYSKASREEYTRNPWIESMSLRTTEFGMNIVKKQNKKKSFF